MPHLLDTQFRMHPAISEFPRGNFYDGRLVDGVTAAMRPVVPGYEWPNPERPVCLVPRCRDTYGTASVHHAEQAKE